MKAVILAGGFGTRLSEETDRIPKPLVEIGGRPILWHIMKIYGHYGICDFIICLGYKGYLIKEYFRNYALHMSDVTLDVRTGGIQIHRNESEPWTVTLVDTGTNTMTGGRLLRIREHLNHETFCMTYGDGLSDINLSVLIAAHRAAGRLATVTAISPPGRFGVLDLEGQRVKQIREKPAAGNALINGGFFVLEPAALGYVDDDTTVWEREPMQALAASGNLNAYVHPGFWQPMDTLRERRMLEELWNDGRAPWKVWA